MDNNYYCRGSPGGRKNDVTKYLTRFGIQRRAVAYPKGIYTIVAGKTCEAYLFDGHDCGSTYYRGDSIIVFAAGYVSRQKNLFLDSGVVVNVYLNGK
ncbi:hypothetical protein D5P88_26025 [Salmonella enterica subsp. enterica]|nr:hypothetical protein [Salmonella enterica subsp. enterica]